MPPEQDDSPDPEEGSVLSPEELDITEDERVEELEQGRYVISSEEEDPEPIDVADASEPDGAGAPADLTESDVHAWLEDHVSGTGSQYGFDITALFEGSVDRRELFSNDVATSFESLLIWYAQHVGDDTPVEEVVGILLMEANVQVEYPAGAIRELVSRYDLDRDDSIADLIDAVDREGSVRFPP